jgi:hypothetical protein
MIAVGGMESISLVVHRQRLKIGNALQPARALREWLMWFWVPIPFCRTLWKCKTIGWTLNFIHMLRALLISPRLASRGRGLLMGGVSVALRRGIRLATAPIAERGQKPELWWIWETFNGLCQASVQNKERAPEDARARGEINVVTGSEPLLPHSMEV